MIRGARDGTWINVALALALIVAGLVARQRTVSATICDDIMTFRGITYWRVDAKPLATAAVGSEYARVLSNLNSIWDDFTGEDGNVSLSVCGPHYEGFATGLRIGTPVYEVPGYTPAFRLATLRHGPHDKITLWESHDAWFKPAARLGADLYDIRGRVKRVSLGRDEYGLPLATINQPLEVERLVNLMLTAPVERTNSPADGPSVGIEFHLDDRTTTSDTWTASTGQLRSGIQPQQAFGQVIAEALGMSE